ERATLERWLGALPAGLIRSRPRLLLAQARLALLSGRLEAVDGLLDNAERAFADAADEPFEPSAGKAASALVNVPAAIALEHALLAYLRGDAEGTARFASQALATLGEGEWMLDLWIQSMRALAELLRGRLAAAERAFAASITEWWSVGEPAMAASDCHLLGQVQRALGRLDAALDTYQQALEMTAPAGRPALPAAGVAYVGMAEVAYQRGELDAALRHVTEGIPLCRQLVYTQPLATGLAALAWIRHAQGDPAGAREAMGEAGRVAPGPGVASLLNPVPAQRARLLLAQGEVDAAARWVEERGLTPDDEPGYPREPEYLVLARVLLAQDRPTPALELLGRPASAAARPFPVIMSTPCERDIGSTSCPRAWSTSTA
ncbi:MAG TPA: tetratricopeptide repeat protein, partial [Streptosporangiaceae bacterium]|nr:tetratricopeptide repeat protein [Streptosporangiaceae bacterium]